MTALLLVPIVFVVVGVAGQVFRDQALTVTFSLMVSIAAALLLQPVLSARILRSRERIMQIIAGFQIRNA